MRKVFKLDMGYVKEEAERAKQSGQQNAEFYEWLMGDNDLRLGPPFNSKGRLFFPVTSHFEIPPDKQIYKCLETWGRDDCPICKTIEELYEEIPDVDLGRQIGTINYYGNVLDRNGESIWKPCRFTPKVKNWIMTQIDNKKIGDITDPDTGIDLCIKKSKKRGKKGGSFVDYTPGILPDRTPLDDDSNYIDILLENLPDLDSVFYEPNEEMIREMEGAAKRMKMYYLKRNRVDNNNNEERSTNTGKRRYESKGGSGTEKNRKYESKKEPPTNNNEYRGCFASHRNPEKNAEGTYGYNEECEDCLLCPNDMECLDAIQSRKDLNK